MARTPHFDLQTSKPLTPYTVPLILWDVIEEVWADRGVNFTEAFPREDVKEPTISWKIYRKVPGRDGLETLKVRLRKVTREEDSTMLLEQYAQWMTVIYQFDIFHVSNHQANVLTEEFEDLLTSCTPLLKELGVSEWLFDEQLVDQEIGSNGTQDIIKRTLRYRCILERKVIKTVPTIPSIWIVTAVDPQLQQNERITRSSLTARDILSKTWVSNILYMGDDLQQIDTGTGTYIRDVDFKLIINHQNGYSYIEWISNGAHPSPGESYYITYTYHSVSPRVSARNIR